MHQKIFARYIQIADLLGQMFPNVLEVVVHDFSDLDHAIIHIANGHISNRKVGGPASELNMRRLLEQENFPDALVNYTSRGSRSQNLKSSSLGIRDDKGNLIGAFCLHFDTSPFEHFQKFLDVLVSSKVESTIGINDFGASLPCCDEIQQDIQSFLRSKGLITSQLSYKDKQAIVEHLHKQGIFKRKGAISIVSNALQVTRQCVYNYLNLAKKET